MYTENTLFLYVYRKSIQFLLFMLSHPLKCIRKISNLHHNTQNIYEELCEVESVRIDSRQSVCESTPRFVSPYALSPLYSSRFSTNFALKKELMKL